MLIYVEMSLFANVPTFYVTPDYLLNAARKKYGRRIRVIGALESSLTEFWNNVEAKGTPFNPNDKPRPESKVIVDISAKEHCNYGTKEDEIMIVTTKEESTKENKSYSLSFGKESEWQFGGGLNIGASFFNTVSSTFGIEGKRTKGKWESETQSAGNERSLSQVYGVTGTIKVPPQMKTVVTITTYAVTYKLNVKAVISAPPNSYIPFYYSRSSGCCGMSSRRALGYITARELFQDQNEFRDLGYCVQFTVHSHLSYIGEVAEMDKRETPLVLGQ